MVDKLQTVIQSFLDKTGFTEYEREIKKSKSITSQFTEFAGSTLGKVATGYFTITKLIEEYNKMVNGSNYQLEQETKIQATLTGQGFRQEQIDGVKKYSRELQDLGVVAEDITLAGAQQLATFNLTENNLKKLLPSLQDVMLQQKGLASTGGDAVNVAQMLGKGLLGQTGMLEKAGINLNDYQRKLIATGTQEQKVAALVEAVTMNVGEQNKEFLKTPEGKIQAAHNRIASIYADLGGIFRDTRASYWDNMADMLTTTKPFIETILKGLNSGFDTFSTAITGVFNTFKHMPDEVKTTIKILGGFLFLSTFPVAGAVAVIEDIFGAFQGKESVIEPVYNKLMEFLGLRTDFDDFRKSINAFWNDLMLEDKKEEINGFTAVLETFIQVLKTSKGILGIGETAIKGTYATVKGLFTGDFDYSSTQEAFNNVIDNFKDVDDNIGDIYSRYDKHLNNEQLRDLDEFNKTDEAKYFNQFYNSPTLETPKFEINKNEKELPLNSFNNTTNNATTNSNLSSNPVFNNKVEINIQGSADKNTIEEARKMLKAEIKANNEQQIANWKAQAGGNFGGVF